VDTEDTSTSHLRSPAACQLMCEMSQLWDESRNRNARQALLSNVFLDYEQWSLSSRGRWLASSQGRCSKILAVDDSQPGWKEQRVLPPSSHKGRQKQRCAFWCRRHFSPFRDELAWEVDREARSGLLLLHNHHLFSSEEEEGDRQVLGG